MKNQFYFILIPLLFSFKVYAQKTQHVFVERLKVSYLQNPSDSNKPFSFNLIKNDQYILRNNRADTLHHFSFNLDTLTAISFQFPSDTILIPNACKYFGDSVLGTINLTPRHNTNCILLEYISCINPSEIYQSVIPSDKKFNGANCIEYKFFFTNFTKQNIEDVRDLKSYVKLK
jgi:hypothetical protein